MIRKLSLILAILLALCTGFAFAETAGEVEILPIAAEDLIGEWNMEYITTGEYMMTAQGYGLIVTLTFNEDGTAAMDFNGEIADGMQWYIEEGKAFITGYNPEVDVELRIDEYGVLDITDSIGSMFFTRIVEEEA